MKTNVLLAGLFLFTGLISVHAQNKTLGVGTSTPNPNAVLHVESPTANQGLLMPRLTTAQRTASAFQGNLTTADIGLMVFDTDEMDVYTWQGSAWESGSEIPLPYADTLLSAPDNSNLLQLVYAGSATENVGVAQFENLNPNNGFSALFARTNSTTNGAADFVVNNTANTNDAVGVTTNGLGHAGSFVVNNATNPNAALYATTNGTGGTLSSAAIYGETTTAFSAITAVIPASAATSNAISGVTKSTDSGSWAGYFDATTGTAVYGTTKSNVGGALAPVGVYGESTGTGSVGGAFWIRNATNNFPALYSNTIGIGPSLSVNVNNAANNAPAIYGTTNGTGVGLLFNHTGANGDLAIFQSGGSNVARIDRTGVGYFNGGTVNSGADVAEMFDVEGNRNEYEPGDVLVISESTDRTVEKSMEPNSTRVAGVYATKPGVMLTEKNTDASLEALVPMGVIGVIPTKVCAENGAIKRGDLLVTSSRKGHAMKAIPVNINGILIYPTGAVLGKALEDFNGTDTGMIKVLVNVK